MQKKYYGNALPLQGANFQGVILTCIYLYSSIVHQRLIQVMPEISSSQATRLFKVTTVIVLLKVVHIPSLDVFFAETVDIKLEHDPYIKQQQFRTNR